MNRRRTVGVLGGMGPLATSDLYRKIIQATPATSDQDHLPVLIDADPGVPDRTAALLEGGEDPTPWLVRGSRRLADAGAAFIVMPCNTAHAFLDRVQPSCAIPFVNMIDESARAVSQLVPAGASVGILATRGTVTAGLYQAALDRYGLLSAVPDDPMQDLVMRTISLVKSGSIDESTAQPALTAAADLVAGGAQALLAACTELPVVLQQEHVTVPLIDPTDVLARSAVRLATDDAAFEELMRSTEKARSYAI